MIRGGANKKLNKGGAASFTRVNLFNLSVPSRIDILRGSISMLPRTVWCISMADLTLEAIKYDGKRLSILNQLLLPSISEYEAIETVEDAWEAIRNMKVATELAS